MERLAVSSIAWTNNEEQDVAQQLQDLGVSHVELAPTKIWSDPTRATEDQIEGVVNFWKNHGLDVVAFQSMLFGRENLKIFEDEKTREETLDFLKGFIGLAGKMGAKVLVFGSPKNRQRGDMPYEAAFEIARDFFSELGKTATDNNTCFCIEPNPTTYACDFVTNAQQGIDLVSAVDNPGFGLHLDIAGMTLAEDNIERSIKDAAPILRHFHISSPQLGQVEEAAGIDHHTAAKSLAEISYDGYVSIEMRPGDEGTNVRRIGDSVPYAQNIYQEYLS
jgi:sugar phosphate isomerase/epimerase